MKRTSLFRELLLGDRLLVLPGAYDALSARMAESAGFSAIVAGGYSASASLLGQPDIGQLGYAEMVDHYQRICDAVSLPLLADGDTGYGGVANVARTVRGFERAGVAAILLEDQVFPKRCGHFAGKQVVSRQEYIGRIKAAVDTRLDPDLTIVARTDSLATHGLDEAIERLNLAHEAGAGLLFIDALQSVEQMSRFCRETRAPRLASVIEGGRTPELSTYEFERMGFAAALYAIGPLYAAAFALREYYAALARDGSPLSMRARLLDFPRLNEIVGLESHSRFEERIAAEAEGVLNASRG